jgi:uncharacterized protein involved in outer membrane biogenesis
VQTTLLGIGIAIIVALVAALVGPLFIDWGRYRAEFEASASRLTGLDFHVAGSIDARLLPTPTLVLHDIAFGRPDQADKVRARALRIEFALGALARGEWRVADARLEGPQFAASLDRAGQLTWPIPKLGFDLEGVSIERLTIEDGRAIFAEATSDTRLVLERLEFKGEVRSLAGPAKGEGSFIAGGQHYPYRLAASRIGDDGSVKVRLSVDPIDRRLTIDADVSLWIDRGVPRFEGNIQLARLVGRASESARSPITEPWRVSSRIKGDSAAAVLEQIEFQYGPDDRALKLRGTANVAFGVRPQINGVLASTQIDLDRLLALPEATRRQPLHALKTAAESLLGGLRLPIPTTLSIAVDSMTVAGATLQRIGADMTADGEVLEIRDLELRAPGLTQVRLSGRLAAQSTGVRFEGLTKIEANEPRALIAWLTDRTDAQAIAAGPFRLSGDVMLGNDKIEVERLKLEFERMSAAGRVAYAWPTEGRPARLDAALTSPELDLDRVHVLAKAIFGAAPFAWPREGALSFKIARAAVAGAQARDTDVQVRIDGNGVEIERFAVADFGGAALTVKGRIGDNRQSPRGALTVEIDGRGLEGVLAVLDQLAPRAADQLRRSAGRLTPVSLRTSLALEPARPDSTDTGAKLKLDGRAGGLRVALQGELVAAADAFKLDKLAALAAATVNLSGRVEADDGGLLLELTGADRFFAVEKRPARLLLTAKGGLDGELAVDAQVAGALNASSNGTVRVFGHGSPSAKLNIKIANANIRSPRRSTAGRPAELLPTSLNARLALIENTLQLSEVTGTVAGTRIAGRIAVGMRQPFAVDGDIELSAVDLPAVIAVALGLPGPAAASGAGAPGAWPAEPFDPEFGLLSGQLAIKSARVTLTPKLAARDVRGILRFGESEFALQATDGTTAGGRVGAELTFLRRAEGLAVRSRISVTGANAAEILPGDGSLSGRLTFDVSAEGSGMSPVALIGSLAGNGTFMLENGRLARLDPAAFETVIRAVDQGLPIDANRVRDRSDLALTRGGLAVALAEGAISIDAGQARLSNSTVRAQGAELAISGSINLAEAALDAHLALSGTAVLAAAANTRPEIAVALKGPIDAPRRTIDAGTFASWLALRAVEQQSKKLEALEGRASPPLPSAVDGAAHADPAAPVDSAGARAAPDAAQPRPPVRTQAAKPKPSTSEQVPPLPPPIDIRPAPAPRAPRAQPAVPAPSGAATHQQRPAPAPPPARARSLSEILFGN